MDLFPPAIIGLIDMFVPYFAANNFIYFRGFILAYMLLGQTRKCVTNIARACFFVDRHIASWERFLSTSRWNLAGLRKCMTSLLIDKLRGSLLIHGKYLAWLDTTLISKVKGRMAGVQKWHDHSGNPDRGDRIVGHHWALAGLLGIGVVGGATANLCFPLLANLISGQLNPLGFVVNAVGQAQLMTFWDTVCPLLAQLHGMLGHQPMRVVVDAYFSKAPFINWMLSLGIHVVSRMRVDAVGWDDPEPLPEGKKRRGPKPKKPRKGKKWKLANLLDAFPLETVSAAVYGKVREFKVVCRDVWIRGVELQKVRVVVVKAKYEPIILMTTDLNMNIAQIIDIYGRRFAAELAIRDLKQHFGLGDYQCTGHLAIFRYVGLTLIGFCLWRLTLLSDETDWVETQKKLAPLSFVRISRSLRRFVIQGVFCKFAQDKDLQDSQDIPKELRRMVV